MPLFALQGLEAYVPIGAIIVFAGLFIVGHAVRIYADVTPEGASRGTSRAQSGVKPEAVAPPPEEFTRASVDVGPLGNLAGVGLDVPDRTTPATVAK